MYSKYHDLRECNNIRSATTLLGSYHLEEDPIQNLFFKQMIAKFHDDTEVNNWLLPFDNHLDWLKGSSSKKQIFDVHIDHQLARWDYSKEMYPPEQNLPDRYDYIGKTMYFTPQALSQKIWGSDKSITKDKFYLDWLIKKAQFAFNSISNEQKIPTLNSKQAMAIMAIVNSGLDHEKQ